MSATSTPPARGDYFYDVYGNFTTRGWLIYDWRQFQPQPLGSGIFQSTRFNRWFNGVTISGDSQGQYHYAITVGDRIRTTLTPMTFSKPDFNGVQIDFAADKYLGDDPRLAHQRANSRLHPAFGRDYRAGDPDQHHLVIRRGGRPFRWVIHRAGGPSDGRQQRPIPCSTCSTAT